MVYSKRWIEDIKIKRVSLGSGFKILYLVRHGETDWNQMGLIQGQKDISLNENGRKQVALLADQIKNVRIDTIYSSDLIRAYQSARILADFLGIETVNTCEFLRERSFGECESMEILALEKKVPGYETNWSKEIPLGIESLEDVKQRAVKRLEELALEHEHILVISHGALINCFLHHVTKGTEGPGITHLKNSSISTFRYHGDWEVVSVNDYSHINEQESTHSI